MAETRVPTREELQQLPWPAVVAFAARCARRVQPLFVEEAKEQKLPTKHAEGVDKAITFTAAMAAIPADARDPANVRAAVRAVNGVGAARADARVGDAAHHAATAAARATDAAYHNADARGADALVDAATVASAAYDAASAAAAAAATADAIHRDFELLLAACRPTDRGGLGWDDSTPVPPEFFGPLWPWGEPINWPIKEEKAKHRSLLTVDAPDDIDQEYLTDYCARLIGAMDRLHRAGGGKGITLADESFCTQSKTLVPAGVP